MRANLTTQLDKNTQVKRQRERTASDPLKPTKHKQKEQWLVWYARDCRIEQTHGTDTRTQTARGVDTTRTEQTADGRRQRSSPW